MEETLTCDAVRELSPELALGVLVGIERAAVVRHLDGCPECAADVEELAMAVDALLEIVPEVDPPVGFEVRLLARRAEQERQRRARARPRRVGSARPGRVRMMVTGAAAAVVLIGGGIGIGAALSPSHTSQQVAAVRSADLLSHGLADGRVTVAVGHPSWLFMKIEDVQAAGWVRCVVRERGGKAVVVGRFWLKSGYGTWTAQLPMSGRDVIGAELETDSGSTVASARLA